MHVSLDRLSPLTDVPSGPLKDHKMVELDCRIYLTAEEQESYNGMASIEVRLKKPDSDPK